MTFYWSAVVTIIIIIIIIIIIKKKIIIIIIISTFINSARVTLVTIALSCTVFELFDVE